MGGDTTGTVGGPGVHILNLPGPLVESGHRDGFWPEPAENAALVREGDLPVASSVNSPKLWVESSVERVVAKLWVESSVEGVVAKLWVESSVERVVAKLWVESSVERVVANLWIESSVKGVVASGGIWVASVADFPNLLKLRSKLAGSDWRADGLTENSFPCNIRKPILFALV